VIQYPKSPKSRIRARLRVGRIIQENTHQTEVLSSGMNLPKNLPASVRTRMRADQAGLVWQPSIGSQSIRPKPCQFCQKSELGLERVYKRCWPLPCSRTQASSLLYACCYERKPRLCLESRSVSGYTLVDSCKCTLCQSLYL